MRIPIISGYFKTGTIASSSNTETTAAAAAPSDHEANTPSDPEDTANSERASVVFTEATDPTPSASRSITPTPSASEAETPVFTPASTTRSNTPTPVEEDHKPASSYFYYSDGKMSMRSRWSPSVNLGSRQVGQDNTNTAAQAPTSSTSPIPTSSRWTFPKATPDSTTNSSRRRFTDTTLSNFNLPDGAVVSDCQLSNCNGKHVQVTDCSFSRCNFSDSTIADCSFSGSNIRDCKLSDCSFSGSNVRGGSISDCSHSGSVLS